MNGEIFETEKRWSVFRDGPLCEVVRYRVSTVHYTLLYNFHSLIIWLTGLVEVVSTCSRQPNLITCYLINNNDIIPFFVCFQLESQKNKIIRFSWPSPSGDLYLDQFAIRTRSQLSLNRRSLDVIAYFAFLQNWYDRYNGLKVRGLNGFPAIFLNHFLRINVKIYLEFNAVSVCRYNIGKWCKKVSLIAWVRILYNCVQIHVHPLWLLWWWRAVPLQQGVSCLCGIDCTCTCIWCILTL